MAAWRIVPLWFQCELHDVVPLLLTIRQRMKGSKCDAD